MKSSKRNSKIVGRSTGNIVKRVPADKKEEILQLIVIRGAVLQKDLRKELGGNCSRILKRLEEEGLIKRIDVVVEGKNTYLVTLANERGVAGLIDIEESEKTNDDNLEIRDGLAPCFGCKENPCITRNCVKLALYSIK